MDVTPLVRPGQQIIQSYAGGGFRIGGKFYQGSAIVWPEQTETWVCKPFPELSVADFSPLYSHDPLPDVVLLGTGASQIFLPPDLRQALRGKGLVIEVMDTGAACRTYNVLMAEGRRVAAALLAI
ncbi:MAG: Mth938-like domain-containing protein [Micavibrio aeruginosavorus]|uniref:Mth938-like domain-containing protein n=1 Tax=Micavibrio aeruginosavorus TaxID=349221 RepID=A0A7T5UHD4_9BACT|nr:MAG: Mth938-like domain-containing protein [Micavibrio aeruginosavorus]